MKHFKNLGETIRRARLQAKRSQRSIAEAAHTSQAYIDKLEHNQIDPRHSTIARILKELGYELVAVPTGRLPIVQDLLDQREDEPLIEPLDGQDLE